MIIFLPLWILFVAIINLFNLNELLSKLIAHVIENLEKSPLEALLANLPYRLQNKLNFIKTQRFKLFIILLYGSIISVLFKASF